MKTRAIVHLDADAFFASVEQAADPRLRGRPIAVGGGKRGVVASASYEARRFGIRAAMPTGQAKKLFPSLLFLPGDFEKYERFSRWMFSYVYDFTPEVEVGSIDEGYFDLTGRRENPRELARQIQELIQTNLKISISQGLGQNKLVSQIASKLHKPAAFHEVVPGEEKAFLSPLKVSWLPGIGPKLSEHLKERGFYEIGQLASASMSLLTDLFGKQAAQVRDYAQGLDNRPLVTCRGEPKSHSHQETFESDQMDRAWLEAKLFQLLDETVADLRRAGQSARSISVKVRAFDFSEDQSSYTLEEPSDVENDFYPWARSLFQKAWKRCVKVRLLGVKLSHLYQGSWGNLELGLGSFPSSETYRRLSLAIADIRHRYGEKAVMRGHDWKLHHAEAGNSSP